ncbi:uncharacterized protein LOC124542092 [Vanessa cardui]|uniref:uncharacterized protein LOC124542092 n=1 Tax=Vanessa cardui TaxID=171605 RepID=UPI001F129472|nr:uncharacterized protein LOC124542092 [Vanessa cardui]
MAARVIGLGTVTCDDKPNIIDKETAKEFPKRLAQLIVNYNERGAAKIDEILPIRAKYELSPHFETGYVVSEILERYRKMVIHVLKPMEYISDVLFETLVHTELVQKLFLEIYHLVNMVHEIAAKYKASYVKKSSDKHQYDRSVVVEHNFRVQENARLRERDRKKRLKQLNKERKLYLKGLSLFGPRTTKKPSKWWPIDYGWEIDYYW